MIIQDNTTLDENFKSDLPHHYNISNLSYLYITKNTYVHTHHNTYIHITSHIPSISVLQKILLKKQRYTIWV